MSMVCSRYARFLVTPLIFWTTLATPIRSETQQYEGKRIVDPVQPARQPVCRVRSGAGRDAQTHAKPSPADVRLSIGYSPAALRRYPWTPSRVVTAGCALHH
jgi:hypothetical protein